MSHDVREVERHQEEHGVDAQEQRMCRQQIVNETVLKHLRETELRCRFFTLQKLHVHSDEYKNLSYATSCVLHNNDVLQNSLNYLHNRRKKVTTAQTFFLLSVPCIHRMINVSLVPKQGWVLIS